MPSRLMQHPMTLPSIMWEEWYTEEECGHSAGVGTLGTYDGARTHAAAFWCPTALADFLAVPRRSSDGQQARPDYPGETCDLANESEGWSGKPIRPAFVELGGALTMLWVALLQSMFQRDRSAPMVGCSPEPKGGRPRIRSDARSASAITIALIWADGMSGKTEASTTRKPTIPRTVRSGSSTASGPRPMAQVPSG